MHLFSFSQLRACLGMQIVACCASIFNIILSMVKMDFAPSYCWHYHHENFSLYYGTTCSNIEVSFFLNLMSFVAGVALNKPNWIWNMFEFSWCHVPFTLLTSKDVLCCPGKKLFSHNWSKYPFYVFLTCRRHRIISLQRVWSFRWRWWPSRSPWRPTAARWSTAVHQLPKW